MHPEVCVVGSIANSIALLLLLTFGSRKGSVSGVWTRGLLTLLSLETEGRGRQETKPAMKVVTFPTLGIQALDICLVLHLSASCLVGGGSEAPLLVIPILSGEIFPSWGTSG